MTTTQHPVILPPAPEPQGIFRDTFVVQGPRDRHGIANEVVISVDLDGLHIRTSRLQQIYIPADVNTLEVCAALMAARAQYDAEGKR